MADLFGGITSLLKDAIAGASDNHGAIASNIANMNTPNYRRVDVSFKEALAATEATPPDPNELSLKTDAPNMIAINDEIPPQPYNPVPHIDESTQMRVDHSNVDLDQEMALLTQNSAYQQTAVQLLTTQYTRMRSAIEEHA